MIPVDPAVRAQMEYRENMRHDHAIANEAEFQPLTTVSRWHGVKLISVALRRYANDWVLDRAWLPLFITIKTRAKTCMAAMTRVTPAK